MITSSIQDLVVALLVVGCAVYAAWKLMPQVARRSLATALLRVPHLPGSLEATLRKNAQQASGCGCDGCDHAAPKAKASNTKGSVANAPVSQPITFHPRARR
jgi:hypothetical protein